MIEISAPWQQSRSFSRKRIIHLSFIAVHDLSVYSLLKLKSRNEKHFFNLLNLKRKNDCSESEVNRNTNKRI